MSEEPTAKPKIIIDDDWKERVQAEKEAAAIAAGSSAAEPDQASETAGAPETGEPETGAPEVGASGSEAPEAGSPERGASEANSPDAAQAGHALPPASFATLVHSLTAQALSSLGQIPDASGKTNVEIELGKHFIDTLAVLEEKTKGNLDEEEAAALSKMLYELRMLFVHVRKEQQDPQPAVGEAAQDA